MKKVTKYIQRKSLIYKTAVEYGDYTINHVFGCAHGCKYPCYAFLMAKRFGKVELYENGLNLIHAPKMPFMLLVFFSISAIEDGTL